MESAEIVEYHHPAKLDAPSGTAKRTAELMEGDVPIHSVRLPGIVADQEVILGDVAQTLRITHVTTDRTSLHARRPARGAQGRRARRVARRRARAPAVSRRPRRVAVTDHAAERFLQRVAGLAGPEGGDHLARVASRVGGRPRRGGRAGDGAGGRRAPPRRRLRLPLGPPARRAARRDPVGGGRRRRRPEALHRRPAPHGPTRLTSAHGVHGQGQAAGRAGAAEARRAAGEVQRQPAGLARAAPAAAARLGGAAATSAAAAAASAAAGRPPASAMPSSAEDAERIAPPPLTSGDPLNR